MTYSLSLPGLHPFKLPWMLFVQLGPRLNISSFLVSSTPFYLLIETPHILFAGSSWSSAQAFPTEAGPLLLKVTDPAGGTSKLIFDGDVYSWLCFPNVLISCIVHKYLDVDNSGTHLECVTVNLAIYLMNPTFADVFECSQMLMSSWHLWHSWRQMGIDKPFLAKLVEEIHHLALPSKFIPRSMLVMLTYRSSLNQELAYIKANSNILVGFTVWSAGSFDTTYELTVTPNADGTDQPLWINAVRPNLPWIFCLIT